MTFKSSLFFASSRNRIYPMKQLTRNQMPIDDKKFIQISIIAFFSTFSKVNRHCNWNVFNYVHFYLLCSCVTSLFFLLLRALKIDTENKSPIITSNSMRESSTIVGKSSTKLAYQKEQRCNRCWYKCVAHRTGWKQRDEKKSRKVKRQK